MFKRSAETLLIKLERLVLASPTGTTLRSETGTLERWVECCHA
jgi:hypothetical protein